MFHDRFACMAMLVLCCVARGEEAAIPPAQVAGVPAVSEVTGEVRVADLRNAAEEAAQKIRDLREELLQTSPEVKALAEEAEKARARLTAFIQSTEAYRDVTQRLARAEAALAALEAEGAKPPPGQLAKARGELNRVRLEKRRIEKGDGGGEVGQLAAAVTVANRRLQNGIASQPGMGALMTVHSKAVQAYQDALARQVSASSGGTNSVPPAAETPAPAPPSGTP